MTKTQDSADARPLIAYCALHQSNAQSTRDEYVATMLEFHNRIHDESILLVRQQLQSVEEAQNRELNRLRNSLAQFLQTPLRADTEEIQKAIRDSFTRIREMSFKRELPGITHSIEGEVVPLAHGQPPVRKLSLNGSRYLADLGFDSAKKDGGVFESAFIVSGGENLDVLEHIVRDILGIYATTHGRHIREFANYSYCLYNIVHNDAIGNINAQDHPFEAALFFSKPEPDKIKYAPFRSALGSLIESLKKELRLPSVSLWQRKLGLGTGVEFALRVNLSDESIVDDLANWLNDYSGNAMLHRVLAVDARLVLKKTLLVRSVGDVRR